MIKAVIFDMYETLITHYSTPFYFSTQMTKDMGISHEDFARLWTPTSTKRSTGEISFEDIIKQIMLENHIEDQEIYNLIISKRINTKKDLFNHIHPDLIPMLDSLKEQGIKIGLITNCFSEEALIIQDSILYPYFDVPILSYNVGMEKPDPNIFLTCLKQLGLEASECLYIGDGGANELEAARAIGMHPYQCIWYFSQENHPGKAKEDFPHLENPLQILELLK